MEILRWADPQQRRAARLSGPVPAVAAGRAKAAAIPA
jgi:hypothetical protein